MKTFEASDKNYQLLVNGRWFSPGTPTSRTTKVGRHDIAEILLKVALNNNHSLHDLFTKPYFLWFLNIFMMFTYLKLGMFVSSTDQNDQVKYYHLKLQCTNLCYFLYTHVIY
jgi:hypothetical protein